MGKIYAKLIAISLTLLLSVTVVVASTYAWMTIAAAPEATAIQVSIGGRNTILIAADVTETVDGTVYHYPGRFDSELNFTQQTGYAYLNELSGLVPVSTADGVNWLIPTYYDLSDSEVAEGTALVGTLKSQQEFLLDDSLVYANLTGDEEAAGSYLYLDFWVVSPNADYTLRISTGEDSSGSFVVALPQAEEGEEGYTLTDSGSQAAASVRVGMLVNPNYIVDNTMLYYQRSAGYNELYTRLRGTYQEKGSSRVYSTGYRFTIYEPNGDLHPTISGAEGSYLITRPLTVVDGVVKAVDVSDRLTVQTASSWLDSPVGSGTQLEQRFQTALWEPSFAGLSAEEMTARFYNIYLGRQVSPYVSTGSFVKSTANLYSAAAGDRVEADFLGEEFTAGATDDVYIVELERDVPQRIRMFIWLEGTDADCGNGAKDTSFALNLELAGSNQD